MRHRRSTQPAQGSIGREQHNLGPDEDAAFKAYHELMSKPPEKPVVVATQSVVAVVVRPVDAGVQAAGEAEIVPPSVQTTITSADTPSRAGWYRRPVTGRGAGWSLVKRMDQPRRSCSTPCGAWLACASIAVPAWLRIWFLVN